MVFIASLAKKDIDEAVKCFSPSYQAKYQKIFAQMKDKLDVMAEDMQEIRKIKEDAGRMEYEILQDGHGEKYSYGIYFINIFGEWKIEQF
jgi:FKBP-type peptidyl-prolyl cis-trans isomerase